jgi:hypothetical protein
VESGKTDAGAAQSQSGEAGAEGTESGAFGKLSSFKLPQRLGIKTPELLEQFVASGFLVVEEGKHRLTQKANEAGCEFVAKSRFDPYFLWPEGCRP